jgi:hypothetical protein
MSVLIYLNRYYYLYYPSDEILPAYINSFRYKRLEEKGILTDKQLAKEYVDQNLDYVKTAKTLFISKDPADLNSFEFPEKCVIKCTSGTHTNIMVENGKPKNMKKIISDCKYFLSLNHDTTQYRFIPGFDEPQYKFNKKAIIVEEYLGDDIIDYKFFCIKGKIGFVVIDKHENGKHMRNVYDSNMKKTKYKLSFLDNFDQEMYVDDKSLKIIKQFCRDFYHLKKFEFVRLDFYIVDGVVYLGEFTFTPTNCMERYSGDFDRLMYQKYV